jgi:WD40 repeat protein/DNA-binding SARP family transcriptional activator
MAGLRHSVQPRSGGTHRTIPFRLLGPLEIGAADRTVELAGRGQKALMSFLLLHANERVTNEALLEALWGRDSGRSVKRVQMAVARLRKALEPFADDHEPVVRTVPGGYVLDIESGDLDAEVFAGLAKEGAAMLEAGDPDRAARRLREAEALWRGPALVDVAYEAFAQDAIRRLDALRITAIEDRVDADLALGRHGELIPELEGLVAAHPTRDRLARQLMLALYRCGRQVDALAVYQRTRTQLASEFGLDPGPELQRVQARILAQDPLLERGAAELPAELDTGEAVPLAGRRAEYAWLRERWDRARSGTGLIAVLAGPRGIGKTRLAAELAGTVHGEGAAVRYVSATGSPKALADALSAARGATTPALLVVDDADRAALEAVDAVRPALARVPVLTLVTSADPDAPSAFDALSLGPLDVDAVAAIVRAYAPRGSDVEPPARSLLDAGGGLPRRVHELSREWARRETARRVGIRAERTAAGRVELRSMESALAEDVAELQAASDQPARAEPGPTRVVCPFKGLAAFDVADAEYFYGRERLVAALVARLVGASLLGVIGPSGSGKSSVLRAGLLPALAEGVLPGSEDWTPIVMRPGEHPPQDLDGLVGPGRFVLAVDQFEETFTACHDEAERRGFVDALVRLARRTDGRGVIVLALRADQYGRCAEHPELSRLLAADHVLVSALSRSEVRRAIECPAERVGLRVDPELTDRLIADVERQAGALPLLSTALLELWQRRDGRRLRLSAYLETGGIDGAVARLAEGAFTALDPEQQEVARELLSRLTAEGADGTVERRRVPREDLEFGPAGVMSRVLDVLADRRLVTLSADCVELSHEALLREWPRLRAWIDEDREGMRIQRNLNAAAHEWERLQRDEGTLYSGARLTEALEWRATRRGPLNPLEQQFLDASETRRRVERAVRRRRRGLAFGAVTVALVATIGVALTWFFVARERDIAASRDLAAKSASLIVSDPTLGQAVALEALRRHHTAQAENAVRQAAYLHRGTAAAQAHDGIVNDLAVSRDGRQLVTAGEDGRVRVWGLDGLRPGATVARYPSRAMAASFSADGAEIAGVSSDGTVGLVPVRGGPQDELLRLPDGDFARSVEFSPRGERLLIATDAGAVGLVRLDGARPGYRVLGRHQQRARAHFDPRGTRAVSASDDGEARIWTLASGKSVGLAHPAAVVDAAFSPDGRQVATAGGDGVARIWDASDGRLVKQIQVDDGVLMSVGYPSDRGRLVVPGDDGIIRIVDVAGGIVVAEVRGHAGATYDAAFVRDGRALVSVGQDGTLRAWAPPDVTALPVGGADDAPAAISFSPDAGNAVAGYGAGAVRVFDLATGASTALPSHGDWATASYSPDGAFIASASYDATVRLWDVERRTSRLVPTSEAPKIAVAVAPGGQRVATDGIEDDPTMTAPDGSRRVTLRGHRGDVTTLVFSPDGRRLMSASEDKTIRIWSTSDGSLERVLRGHDKAIINAAFSRDGQRVASTDTDGAVRIWSASGRQLAVLYGHEGQANSAEFDRSGDRLVTTGNDGAVRVWSTAAGEPLAIVRRHDGVALNARFSADGERVVSEGAEGVVLSYACETCGSFDAALGVARSRLQRALSAVDRERLLSGDG